MSKKTLAIMISCHGNVPVDYAHGAPSDIILAHTILPFRNFNIKFMDVVTLAKLAGVCFGIESQNNIEKYIRYINRNRDKIYEEENVKTTEQLVDYLFSPTPAITRTIEINDLNKKLFTNSFSPVITHLKDRTIEKIYRPLFDMSGNPHGGVYYLSSDGFTGVELTAIKEKLNENNRLLYLRGYLTKSEILSSLAEFGIDHLYYIDFSCYAYQNINESVGLTQQDTDWLNEQLGELKGGKTKKRNRRKNKKTKNNRRKRNNK